MQRDMLQYPRCLHARTVLWCGSKSLARKQRTTGPRRLIWFFLMATTRSKLFGKTGKNGNALLYLVARPFSTMRACFRADGQRQPTGRKHARIVENGRATRYNK